MHSFFFVSVSYSTHFSPTAPVVSMNFHGYTNKILNKQILPEHQWVSYKYLMMVRQSISQSNLCIAATQMTSGQHTDRYHDIAHMMQLKINAASSCRSFLHYFLDALSCHQSAGHTWLRQWVAAQIRFDYIMWRHLGKTAYRVPNSVFLDRHFRYIYIHILFLNCAESETCICGRYSNVTKLQVSDQTPSRTRDVWSETVVFVPP